MVCPLGNSVFRETLNGKHSACSLPVADWFIYFLLPGGLWNFIFKLHALMTCYRYLLCMLLSILRCCGCPYLMLHLDELCKVWRQISIEFFVGVFLNVKGLRLHPCSHFCVLKKKKSNAYISLCNLTKLVEIYSPQITLISSMFLVQVLDQSRKV